jgi:hypothetical protein
MLLTVSRRFLPKFDDFFAIFSLVMFVSGGPDVSSSVTLSLPEEKVSPACKMPFSS